MKIGQRFGKWKVIGKGSKHKGGTYYLCRCDCGTTREVRGSHLSGGKSHSCGCSPYPTFIPASSRRIQIIRNRLQASAKRRNIRYALPDSLLEELTSQPCHYCGKLKLLTAKSRSFSITYQGLDRKDPSKGYIPDNVVPCCVSCNKKKGKLGYSEFLATSTT